MSNWLTQNTTLPTFSVSCSLLKKILIESCIDSSPKLHSDLHVLPTMLMEHSSSKGTLPGPAHDWRRRKARREAQGKFPYRHTMKRGGWIVLWIVCLLRHTVLPIIVVLHLDSTVIGTSEKSLNRHSTVFLVTNYRRCITVNFGPSFQESGGSISGLDCGIIVWFPQVLRTLKMKLNKKNGWLRQVSCWSMQKGLCLSPPFCLSEHIFSWNT